MRVHRCCPPRAQKDVLLASLISLASVSKERKLTQGECRLPCDVSSKLLGLAGEELLELEKAGMSYTLKSKTETLTTETTDEIDEAEYQKMFPNHHAAFNVHYDDEADGYKAVGDLEKDSENAAEEEIIANDVHGLSDQDLVFSANAFLSALHDSHGTCDVVAGATRRFAYRYRCLEHFLNEGTVAEGVGPSSLGEYCSSMQLCI